MKKKYTYILRLKRPDILERVKRNLDVLFRDDVEYSVVIKPYVDPATISQHGYYRSTVLPTMLMSAEGHTAEDLHESMLKAFAPRETRKDVVTGQEYIALTRTSGMDKAQFAEWLTKVIHWSESNGVMIPPPRSTKANYWEEVA